MFGYVNVNKPELKFREFDLYQTYYCGLCDSLRKHYGLSGQLSLTYDMTFLILLLTGLYEPENKEGYIRCLTHPLHRHYTNQNLYTDYGAAMNVLLTYYQCLDDWKDEKNGAKLLYSKALRKKAETIGERYPRQQDAVVKNLDALSAYEKAETREGDTPRELMDISSGYFGALMSELFVYEEDRWSDPLRRVGFYLGKFIFLSDAYEDLEKDEKKGLFNPLAGLKEKEDFDDFTAGCLTMMMAECTRAFEYLPIVMGVELLRNILYSGVWSRFEWAKAKRKARKEKEKGHGSV